MEVAKTTLQGRFLERTVVQTEDVPVPQILKEVVEVVKAVKTVPQDRIPETICEQIVDAPVPQAVDEPVPSFQDEIDDVIKLFPEEHTPKRIIQGFTSQERISERINEQTVDQPGDQARRDPADSIHRQSCRHAGGDAVTGPSDSRCAEDRGSTSDYADVDEFLEVVKDIPPELMSEGLAKDILAMPMAPWQREMDRVLREKLARRLAECAADPAPQFEDQTVEVVKTTPQERTPKRTRANRRRATAARWDGAGTWWWWWWLTDTFLPAEVACTPSLFVFPSDCTLSLVHTRRVTLFLNTPLHGDTKRPEERKKEKTGRKKERERERKREKERDRERKREKERVRESKRKKERKRERERERERERREEERERERERERKGERKKEKKRKREKESERKERRKRGRKKRSEGGLATFRKRDGTVGRTVFPDFRCVHVGREG